MGCLIEIEKKSETGKIIPYKRSLFLKLPEINIKKLCFESFSIANIK